MAAMGCRPPERLHVGGGGDANTRGSLTISLRATRLALLQSSRSLLFPPLLRLLQALEQCACIPSAKEYVVERSGVPVQIPDVPQSVLV